MIEPTLGTAVAAVLAAVGVTSLASALRWAMIDDAVLGAILLVVAWYVTTMGPML